MENPEDIQEKITTYNQQYQYALDDFTNSYIHTEMNPDSSEYQNIYASRLGTLQLIEANLFTTTNDIQKNIELLNEYSKTINHKIQIEKELNDKLKKAQSSFYAEDNGSKIMIVDSKQMYTSQRIANFSILIGIFLLLGFISNILDV